MRSPSKQRLSLPRAQQARSLPQHAQPATRQLQLVVVVVVLSGQLPWPCSSGRSNRRVGAAHRPATRTTTHAALPLPGAAQPPHQAVQGRASDPAHLIEVPQPPAPGAACAAAGRARAPIQFPCVGCETDLCLVPQRSGRHRGPPLLWGRDEGSPPPSHVCSAEGGGSWGLGPTAERQG